MGRMAGGGAGPLPGPVRPNGEKLILEQNLFVEYLLRLRDISDEVITMYRSHWRVPGEARRPMLCWKRGLPIAGEPADVVAVVDEYARWLSTSEVPKLFINGDPSGFLIGAQRKFSCTSPSRSKSRPMTRTSCRRMRQMRSSGLSQNSRARCRPAHVLQRSRETRQLSRVRHHCAPNDRPASLPASASGFRGLTSQLFEFASLRAAAFLPPHLPSGEDGPPCRTHARATQNAPLPVRSNGPLPTA